jgi:hypothetical protein
VLRQGSKEENPLTQKTGFRIHVKSLQFLANGTHTSKEVMIIPEQGWEWRNKRSSAPKTTRDLNVITIITVAITA